MVEPSSKTDSIFWSALGIAAPDERARYLDDACADDPNLRAQLDEMLAAYPKVERFLERPAFADATAVHEPLIAEGPGTIIGPYKLLEQIGEGGMGVVFMAEQTEPLQRTVALKIIKQGMDTRQVIARFEAERQAVAMMDHPNIAKVLDAGTTGARSMEHGAGSPEEFSLPTPRSSLPATSRPYFVMELVKGVPITKYCDDKRLPVRQRLELFTRVCQAVQHAHQKGVIHRDIKPNNVLVAEYDNHAVPKVIDFGVAKATAQKLNERTMFTEFGQVLGTMEYMSPEQSKFNQLDIDTRSDIYSLGVLLYELLAGSTPFEGKRLHEAAFDEMLRIIREEEPPKPSTRVSASDTLPSIAANRHTEPARLSKDVRGELDWIVMKALEKDRNRRYDTAAALADDILHYLNDEPVAAVAPSRIYRARKFILRNKWPMIAAAAVLVGLVAAIIGTTIGLASQSRQRAIAERERAEAQLNLAAALQQQDRNTEAEKLYRQALATAKDTTPADRQRAARTLLRLAQVVGQRGDAAESEQLYRKALAAYRAAFAPDDANLAHALTNLALILREQGRWTDVEPLFREAYEINRQAAPADHRLIGVSAVYLGHALFMLDKYAEAEPLLRESIAQYQRVVPPDDWAIALARVELGRDLNALGRRPEAEVQLLDAVRVLEPTRDFNAAASVLAAFYSAWDEAEPGKGHDLQARECFRTLINGLIRPDTGASETKNAVVPDQE